MGKVYFGIEDYQQTFEKLHGCYLIRQKILKNSEHADLLRVKKFAKILCQRVEDMLEDKKTLPDLRIELEHIRMYIVKSPMF